MMPEFAAQDTPSRPIYAVVPDGLEAWLEAQPAPVADWLRDAGFKAAYGEVMLIPGAGVSGAVIGLGTAAARRRQRFGLAKAVAVLPAGVWHFEGLPGDLATEAALGWLLAQYRFDRYKPAPRDLPQLKCPEGVCAISLRAMAAGEFLTRDLINTPASDLGPEELQKAFLALAQQFDARTEVVQGADLERDFPMVHAVRRLMLLPEKLCGGKDIIFYMEPDTEWGHI